jgi:hypothetical protein
MHNRPTSDATYAWLVASGAALLLRPSGIARFHGHLIGDTEICVDVSFDPAKRADTLKNRGPDFPAAEPAEAYQ